MANVTIGDEKRTTVSVRLNNDELAALDRACTWMLVDEVRELRAKGSDMTADMREGGTLSRSETLRRLIHCADEHLPGAPLR